MTPQFKTIRSFIDAYDVALALHASLADGESTTWNCTAFTRLDDDYTAVVGFIGDTRYNGNERFMPSELAEFVIFPERKQFNDYIRSRILPEQKKRLAAAAVPFEVYEENALGYRETMRQAQALAAESGADAYLKAMLEAAEAGEDVDWGGVYEVVGEALGSEAERPVQSAQPQRFGCFAVGWVTEGEVVIETTNGTFVNGLPALPAQQ